MIWIVFALMVAAVLAVMLVPMARARPAAVQRSGYDIAVYRDQLAEVDRDVERAVLTADQAEAARTEIQRRMLAAADAGRPAAAGRGSARTGLMAALTVAVAAVAFGGYALLGSPGLPDQPLAARAGKIQDIQAQDQTIRTMVDGLTARLAKNPADGRGWAMLGRSRHVLGEDESALEAYEKALPLLPGDAQVRQEYAALVVEGLPENAPLPPRLVAVMRELLAIDPQSPDALYFLGVAEAQAGRKAAARGLWNRLLALLPPDSPARGEVIQQIEGLR